jgi:endonuclease/exonuclease/phosphatase family metal-dependent hydrolase
MRPSFVLTFCALLAVACGGSAPATAPRAAISGGPSELTNQPDATFVFAADPASARTECRLDGATFAACQSPLTVTVADGTHSFEVQALSTDGVRSVSPAGWGWKVDATPPDTTLDTGPTGTTDIASASFTFHSSEEGGSFHCVVDGVVLTSCPSSGVVISDFAPGPHTFTVAAVDPALNQDPTPASTTWTVSATVGPPDTTIDSAPASPSGSATVQLAFHASEAGCTFLCSLDGAAATACVSPVSVSGLTEGSHTFTVRATSAQGVVDPSPASATWTTSFTPPETTLDSVPPATSGSSVQLTFHASEAACTFLCSLDGATATTCTSPVSYSGLGQGSHTFTVQATDAQSLTDPTPASASWTVSGTTLRVMSANLTTGNHQSYDDATSGGGGCKNTVDEYGTGEGKRILQGMHPDVVAIQEFNDLGCDGANSEAYIRAFVDDAFGAGFSYYREPYLAAGNIPNGIISRYPILASGSWADTVQTAPNRGFAWAQIDVPGPTDLYVISVHLLTSSPANRAAEADLILADIQATFPAGAWVILAGDFNTHARDEDAISHLTGTFVTAGPYPADQTGNDKTNSTRQYEDDWVLATSGLDALKTPLQLGSSNYANGLVFDARVYSPLSEVSPVLATDSDSAAGMQHMAVVRDFLLP